MNFPQLEIESPNTGEERARVVFKSPDSESHILIVLSREAETTEAPLGVKVKAVIF